MARLPETGVNLPRAGTRRSSVATSKTILADAVALHDPELAARVTAETDWRHNYPAHFGDLTLAEARTATAAVEIAAAGLESAQRRFVYVTEGDDKPLPYAIDRPPAQTTTTRVRGNAPRRTELAIPYQGRQLRGAELLRQLDDWVVRGITEPSFADALGAVVANPDWLDLTDRQFAIFGPGAQMGPFAHLVSWGASIAVLGTPRPQTWDRLATITEHSAGQLLIPVTKTGGSDTGRGTRGIDLLTQPGELAHWLDEIPGPLTVANYGYLDGADFVRLTAAFDTLLLALARRRGDMSLAYLATPSDAFLVPADAVAEAQRRWQQPTPAMLAARAVHQISRGTYLRPNYSGASRAHAGRYGLVNAFITDQGPNYALAKRLQRWRMIIARASGTLTSVHVAPPTQTASVHSNPAMAERQRLTAYLGLETFEAATAQAIGAAILVHDLRNPGSPANPDNVLHHPHEAFMFAANPGGRWRAALDPTSSLPVIQQLHTLRRRGPHGARLAVQDHHA